MPEISELCPRCGGPSRGNGEWACGSFGDREGSHYQSRECIEAERDRLRAAVRMYLTARWIFPDPQYDDCPALGDVYAALKLAAGVE